MIFLFFALNLLTGGLGHPWFIYPSAPFAVIILLRALPGGRDGMPS